VKVAVERSITGVVSDLFSEFAGRFGNEFRIARRETSEKINLLRRSLVVFGLGAALLMAGVVILLEAAVAGLITAGFSLAVSSLIVGGPILFIGLIVLCTGASISSGRRYSESDGPARQAPDLRQK